eukprot:1144916-Pelagomonas_calceolata.AAC.22
MPWAQECGLSGMFGELASRWCVPSRSATQGCPWLCLCPMTLQHVKFYCNEHKKEEKKCARLRLGSGKGRGESVCGGSRCPSMRIEMSVSCGATVLATSIRSPAAQNWFSCLFCSRLARDFASSIANN